MISLGTSKVIDREWIVIQLFLLVALIGTVIPYEVCPAYCNAAGYYVPGSTCGDDVTIFYCCGNQTSRWCCSNQIDDITGLFSDQCICPNSSCSYNNWDVIAGAVTTTVLFILIAACCWHAQCNRRRQCWQKCCPPCCLNYCCRDATSTVAIREESVVASVSASVGPDGGRRDINGRPFQTPATSIFDPLNQFAFNPPPYDSLSKDPPKYEEIAISYLNERNCGNNSNARNSGEVVGLSNDAFDASLDTITSGPGTSSLERTASGSFPVHSYSSATAPPTENGISRELPDPPPYVAVDSASTTIETSAV